MPSPLFISRAGGEIANNGQTDLSFLGGVDQQVDPADEDRQLEQGQEGVLYAEAVRVTEEDGGGGGGDDEPGDEEVEGLEAVEADAGAGAEAAGG